MVFPNAFIGPSRSPSRRISIKTSPRHAAWNWRPEKEALNIEHDCGFPAGGGLEHFETVERDGFGVNALCVARRVQGFSGERRFQLVAMSIRCDRDSLRPEQ